MSALNVLQQHLTSPQVSGSQLNEKPMVNMAGSSNFSFQAGSKPLSNFSKGDISLLSNKFARSSVKGILDEEKLSDPIGTVEQMTSDSSSSSSSGDEGNDK